MELVILTSEAYKEIVSKLDQLVEQFGNGKKLYPLDDHWLDIQEVCNLLKLSKRSLQIYRKKRILPFSQIKGKIYFKASDIQKYLERHYTPANKK